MPLDTEWEWLKANPDSWSPVVIQEPVGGLSIDSAKGQPGCKATRLQYSFEFSSVNFDRKPSTVGAGADRAAAAWESLRLEGLQDRVRILIATIRTFHKSIEMLVDRIA